MNLKAYPHFIQELNNLSAFYKATLYSYEQTESLIAFYKKNKIQFDDDDKEVLKVNYPHSFKIKKSSKNERRKNLNELIFVRVISALEVFLIDLIKDTFLANKEPFKKQDIILQFTQSELLSIKSPAEIFNKIINKESRKLSSGGLGDIAKYYKRNFDIEISGFTPGITKMEEYHDRRHLLVHRLGRTDQQFRKKYNVTTNTISISQDYLQDCIKDFRNFAELLNNQITYKLKNDFLQKIRKEKNVDRSLLIEINILKENKQAYIEDNYEFWAEDTFLMLTDILDSKRYLNDKTIEMKISGSFQQVKAFTRILKKGKRKTRN